MHNKTYQLSDAEKKNIITSIKAVTECVFSIKETDMCIFNVLLLTTSTDGDEEQA